MRRDLNAVCGVKVTTTKRGYWSYAQITATDATTILDCVLDKAPSYPGGDEIVTDLRSVEPGDAFGIPQALPAGTTVAVKNGWTAHSGTGKWNVNCVAAWDHYTLAVLLRYPIARKLDYGATCAGTSPQPCSPGSAERRGWSVGTSHLADQRCQREGQVQPKTVLTVGEVEIRQGLDALQPEVRVWRCTASSARGALHVAGVVEVGGRCRGQVGPREEGLDGGVDHALAQGPARPACQQPVDAEVGPRGHRSRAVVRRGRPGRRSGPRAHCR